MFVDLSPKCTNFILTLYFSITVVIIYPFIKMQVLKHKKGIIVRGKEDCLKFSISASHNKRQADMKQLRQNISTYFSRTRAHWRPRRPPHPSAAAREVMAMAPTGRQRAGSSIALPRPPWLPHHCHGRPVRHGHPTAATSVGRGRRTGAR